MNGICRYRATIAYDGAAYRGFQRQAEGIPTVQGAVEQAIFRLSGQEVTVIGAGRTDSGVHARGQVIAFDLAWRHADTALLRALNANLPDDIAVQQLCQHPGFHPRFDAVARYYRYTVISAQQRQPLWARQAWYVANQLDHAVMQAAAKLLIGQHDFAAFGNPPQGTNTVREVLVSRWEIEQQPGVQVYTYHVEANAFLHHMVRRLVGLQVEVGRGLLTLDDFRGIFASCDLSRTKVMAPPQGLVLESVRYREDTPPV